MAYDPKDPADVAAVQALIDEAISPLKTKRDQLLAENRKLKQGAEIDPADLQRVEAERDDLAAKLADAQKAIKTATKSAEDAGKLLQGEQGYVQKLLVDNGLAAALTEAGVSNPVQLRAAAALIRASAQIDVKVDGANRAAVVGDKDLASFVKEWSQGDEGKHFVAAQGNSGGNAPGNTNPNQHNGAGNMGGTRDERATAIAARFPNLPK